RTPSPGPLAPVPARPGPGGGLPPPLLVDQPLAPERLLGREVGVVRLVVRAGSEEGEGGRAAALQAVHHAAAPRDGRVEPAPGVGDRLQGLALPILVRPFGVSPTSLLPSPLLAPGPSASLEFAAGAAVMVLPATVLEVVSDLSSGASSFGSHRCLRWRE